MITYDEALERIESYLAGSIDSEHREAYEMARMALKDAIGRGRRFETDLEDAESDYTRDFAAEQDLYGENADSFFGKVKADGFDIMEAFHDGAEWRREKEWHDMGKQPMSNMELLVRTNPNNAYMVMSSNSETFEQIGNKWAYIDDLTGE